MFDVENPVREFEDDEVSADAKYKGRLVGVSGPVREIGKEKGALSDQSCLDQESPARVRCCFNKDKVQEGVRDLHLHHA
jgi:hypothetical protein